MRKWVWFTGLLWTAGCAARAPHSLEAWPMLTSGAGEASQTASDWSGRWVVVRGDLNAPMIYTRQAPCGYDGIEFLALNQQGDRIYARLYSQNGSTGVKPTETHDDSEEAAGTRRDDHVTLRGKHVVETVYEDYERAPERETMRVVYDLDLDPDRLHLVGTRNNEPVRLVPLTLEPISDDDCNSPPP